MNREQFCRCRDGDRSEIVDADPCVYLSIQDEGQHSPDQFKCLIHKKCTLKSNLLGIAACEDCKDRTQTGQEGFSEKFLDPLTVTDRHKNPTHALRGMLAGGAAFLVGGGPSLKDLDLSRLLDRGMFSLGINNVAGLVPVNAFTCSDPPNKFHWGIFADPRIMKFLPIPKLGRGRNRGQLRIKENGEFRDAEICAVDCPNVWGYERRSWLMPDATFFTEPSASWGNQQVGVDRFGQRKTACTMLLGIRLLYYLGARTIFLLGCDFRMKHGIGDEGNYAFGQKRSPEAVQSNNEHFQIVDQWLTDLKPTLDEFGLGIYNCYRQSGLRAFPYVSYETALDVCRGTIPDEPFDLEGWYEK